MKTVIEVLDIVSRIGLGTPVDGLLEHELEEQRKWIKMCVKTGISSGELLAAAKYGMSNVWPFTEGRSWDAEDLYKNLSKAKAEAKRAHQRGEVPFNAQRGEVDL